MNTFNTFRLIGRTNTFTVTKFYKLHGVLECVEGVTTINGKSYVTRACVADVVPM